MNEDCVFENIVYADSYDSIPDGDLITFGAKDTNPLARHELRQVLYNPVSIPETAVFNNYFICEGFNGLNLTVRENRIYMSIISALCGRGTDVVNIDYTDLKQITKESKKRNRASISSILQSLRSKLEKKSFIRTPQKSNDNSHIFFEQFDFDSKKAILTVKASNSLSKFLRQQNSYFTIIKLDEYMEIKSKHAQILYRRICQFKKSKEKLIILSLQDIRDCFSIPKHIPVKRITSAYLFPAECELRKIGWLKNLRGYPKREKHSNKIYSYLFCWSKKQEA